VTKSKVDVIGGRGAARQSGGSGRWVPVHHADWESDRAGWGPSAGFAVGRIRQRERASRARSDIPGRHSVPDTRVITRRVRMPGVIEILIRQPDWKRAW
jgi:hypothetical protein